MATLGDAVVAITADTSGLSSQLSKAFRSTPVVGALDDFGGTITNIVGKAFTAAAVSAGAVAAKGLWGGLKRALDREDAIITFRRLGLDQKNIDQMVDSIDKALSGTPITNPEGFALAGRFLAQGFAEADIPKIVGTIADMASVGNRSFQEMADVMVAAAGQGRIMSRDLMRLGDIPLSRVAEELGMTESELRKMVSAGELTADTFMEAFSAIEEFNGAAKDATTRTAWKNFWTAVSKGGEAFLGPFLGEGGFAQTAMLRLRDLVDRLTPRFREWGQIVADKVIPRMETLITTIEDGLDGAFDDLNEWLSKGVDLYHDHEEAIKKFTDAFIPAVGIVAGMGTAVHILGGALKIALAGSPVGILIGIAGGLVYLWQNSEKFRDVITGMADKVTELWDAIGGGEIVQKVGEWFSDAWDTISKIDWGAATENATDAVGGLADGMGRAFDTIGRVASEGWGKLSEKIDKDQTAERFGSIWTSLGEIVSSTAELIALSWNTLWDTIDTVWATVGDPVTTGIAIAFDWVSRAIDSSLKIISGALDIVIGVLTGDWSRAWQGAQKVFGGVWLAITSTVTTSVNIIRTVISVGVRVIRAVWDGVWGTIQTIIDTVWGFITGVISGGMDDIDEVITTVTETIGTVWDTVWGGIRTTIETVWGTITSTVETAINTVSDTVTGALDTLGRIWDDTWGPIVEFVEELPGKISRAFQRLSAIISGPFKLAFNAISNAWNSTIGSFRISIPDFPGIPGRGRTISFPSMPTFAQGGPVLDTGPIFAHRGEHVLTTDLTRRLDRFLTRQPAGAGRVDVGGIEIHLPEGVTRLEAEQLARTTVDAALSRLVSAGAVA